MLNLKIGSFKIGTPISFKFAFINRKQFKIKFSINEMTELKTVKDIKLTIQKIK